MRPFEMEPDALLHRMDEAVDATFADLTSEFLVLPKGTGFIEYADFQEAYEVLKRHTRGFAEFTSVRVRAAVLENARSLGVIRAILGMSGPEWAELAQGELGCKISQNDARQIDRESRGNPSLLSNLDGRYRATSLQTTAQNRPEPTRPLKLQRIDALIDVAVEYITRGAPQPTAGVVHRLAKFDTRQGLESVQYVAAEHAPYAVLLYERYLGRPFASHRDAVSELIGEVMENAVEARLRSAGIAARRTVRAEHIPGFGQAPDFIVPDEEAPAVIIEAKITSDDGTARDKVSRIFRLSQQRREHVANGRPDYQVVACIDGRGFRVRRELMKDLIRAVDGLVFTTATLNQLVAKTRLSEFSVQST